MTMQSSWPKGYALRWIKPIPRSDTKRAVMKKTTVTIIYYSVALLALAGFLLRARQSRSNAKPSSPAPAQANLLKQVGTIDLPGPKGKRFDYLTIDSGRNLLFSTHLGAGILYVIDLRTGKLVKMFEDLPGIEGVEIAADVNKAYTSNWQENKIGVIDLQQMKLVKKLPTESKPDGITYAAPFHKIYVSDERGHAEAVVDVMKDEVVTTLHFESETGNPRYDPVAKRVYVNLQDKNVIAEIDPASDKQVAEYPVGKCRGNHGMALDSEHRLAFLSCEENDLMTVFRLDTH